MHAVLLLAFVLRASALGRQSLWYDEAFSLLLARDTFGGIVERTARDTMPPLYYWVLHLWGTGPPVDLYPRFPSVLAGTLSVALVYAVARSLLGGGAGVAAGVFAAVAPFHVFYSQEVRMYALLGLWSLLAAWGFTQGWWKQRRSGWVVFSAGTLLALYTHALGWLPSAAFVTWAASVVASQRLPRGRLVPPLLALAAAAVLYLPWSVVLASQVPRVFSTFWTPAPGPLSPFVSLYLLFEGPFAGWIFPAALSSVLLALGLTIPSLRRRPDGLPLSFLWVWAVLPLLTLLALSLVRPVYLERVVIGAAFPVYILLGWVLAWGVRRRAVAAVGLLVLACGLWGLMNWYLDPAAGKPPYREAAALVHGRWAGEPVLHTSDASYLPFLLYGPQLQNHLLTGDPEAVEGTPRARSTYDALGVVPAELSDAVGQARRFFLVVALEHSVEFQREVVEEVDRRYRLVREENAGGIVVRVYER